MRACVDGTWQFHPTVDIVWSPKDRVAAAESELKKIGVPDDQHDGDPPPTIPLFEMINREFRTIDPAINLTRYTKEGSQWAEDVNTQFSQVKSEFYVWAIRNLQKNNPAESILRRLKTLIGDMRDDLKKCEAAQRETCVTMASVLLHDETSPTLKIQFPNSISLMLTLKVQMILAKHIKNKEALRDQHTICFAMNIVRETLGIPLVADKYAIQFPGIKNTIVANKHELSDAAHHTVSFGHLCDMLNNHYSVGDIMKELVDENGENPEFHLNVFEEVPADHQVKNDLAFYRMLSSLFTPKPRVCSVSKEAILRYLAQQDESVSLQWSEHAPVANLFSQLDIRTIAVEEGSIWLLHYSLKTTPMDRALIVKCIRLKQAHLVKYLANTHEDAFIAHCLEASNTCSLFTEAIRSGNEDIFTLVSTPLIQSTVTISDIHELVKSEYPVHAAVESGNPKTLEILVNTLGFDVRCRDSANRSPIETAIRSQKSSTIPVLRQSLKLSPSDPLMKSLLSLPIANNATAVIKALVAPLPNDTLTIPEILTALWRSCDPKAHFVAIFDALIDCIKSDIPAPGFVKDKVAAYETAIRSINNDAIELALSIKFYISSTPWIFKDPNMQKWAITTMAGMNPVCIRDDILSTNYLELIATWGPLIVNDPEGSRVLTLQTEYCRCGIEKKGGTGWRGNPDLKKIYATYFDVLSKATNPAYFIQAFNKEYAVGVVRASSRRAIILPYDLIDVILRHPGKFYPKQSFKQ